MRADMSGIPPPDITENGKEREKQKVSLVVDFKVGVVDSRDLLCCNIGLFISPSIPPFAIICCALQKRGERWNQYP